MADAFEVPLARRTVHDTSTARSWKVVNAHPTAGCGGYTAGAMQEALQAVEQGGTSIRSAAKRFNVARSTLHDHVSGKVKEGAARGPPTYLTEVEEEELASFFLRCANIGYGHTLEQALALVQGIIDSKGIKKEVTRGWWQKFCRRHSSVALCTAVPLSVVRAMATDRDVLDRYFTMLLDTFAANKVLQKPTQIFNCDETGMPLGATNRRVVASVGSSASCITSNSKLQITVLACVSAAGISMPPFIIFQRKTINDSLIIGEVPGTLYGLSEKGWMTRELFSQWFYKHFLSYIPKHRPVVLLMDGHSSHYCPDTIRMAAKEKVVLCTLPPHTSHLTQPLDKGCFGPLKTAWRHVCQEFCARNVGRVVTIYDFSKLFSQAWYQSMTMKNITSGFKVTGVFPVDRSAVTLPQDIAQKKTFRPEALAIQSGLAYIPLYSPAPPKTRKTTPAGMQSTSSSVHSTVLASSLNNSSSFLERSQSEDNLSIGNNSSYCMLSTQRSSSVSNLLSTPIAPSKLPTKRLKSCGQVLTAADYMERMEEAEKVKKDKEKLAAKARKEKSSSTSRKANPKSQSKVSSNDPAARTEENFSAAELQKFSKRYENGYDLLIDTRYNLWLELHHPAEYQKLISSNEPLTGSGNVSPIQLSAPSSNSTPKAKETRSSRKVASKTVTGRDVQVHKNRTSTNSSSKGSRIPRSTATLEKAKQQTNNSVKVTWKEPLESHYLTKSGNKTSIKAKGAHVVTRAQKKLPVISDDEGDSELEISLEYCAAEKCMIEQFPLRTVQWIACDICKHWFHKYCCDLSEKANPRYFKCKKHQ